MTDLTTLWRQYKNIQNSASERTPSVRRLEEKIHEAQKFIPTPPYDFDKWWAKRELMSKSSVSGTTIETPEPEKAPQANFSLEQAKQLIGDNDCVILTDCAKRAEAIMIYLAHELEKINPSNMNNPARRGQAINQTLYIFNDRKKQPA